MDKKTTFHCFLYSFYSTPGRSSDLEMLASDKRTLSVGLPSDPAFFARNLIRLSGKNLPLLPERWINWGEIYPNYANSGRLVVLSENDVKILSVLQQDAKVTMQTLSDTVGMSPSPCWRRVRQLEEQDVILGYRAVLNRRKIGLGVLVFVKVKIDRHSETEAKRFERDVRALDEVIACYSIGGDADFLLQVAAPDLDAFAEFAMTAVRQLPGIKEMQSMFVLKEIKPFWSLPIRPSDAS